MRLDGDKQAARDDEQVQRQQRQHAEQSEFLAHDREDEIRITLGKEFELCLRAVGPAFAKQSPGADGDLGLDDVVAGPQRIAVRVEQREHALLLIVLHEIPERVGAGD